MKKIFLSLVMFLCANILIAQTTISGKVFDEYLEPFTGATVKAGKVKVLSDYNGDFTLKLQKKLPITIEVSSVGYQTEIIEVTDLKQDLNFVLKETSTLNEVVISASRTPERILESPVTIERVGINTIKRGTQADFYDVLENLKGVDMNTKSIISKSINTRSFGKLENYRVVQLIDGMDNMIPSVNSFSGNLAGVNGLDVQSIEVLPGASSALYGANAINGLISITTKNPFDFQGISVMLSSGVTKQKAAGTNPFYNTAIRMGYAFSKKLAAKANFSYLKIEEWHANDYRNSTTIGGKVIPGDRNNTDYDGINIYGDEYKANLKDVARIPYFGLTTAQISAVPNVFVSRDGYNDVDLMNNHARNIKFDGSLHYRPWGNDKLEIIWNSRFNLGDYISQAGSNRYTAKDGYLEQHKLEFKGSNYFVRGYYSRTKSGDSYDSRLASYYINSAWKGYDQWFGEYLGAYLKSGSHQVARDFANKGQVKGGSSEFNTLLNKATRIPIKEGGAFFVDNSGLYHIDANMNFRDYIKWAEIQIGGSYRSFFLNSDGNVYTDYDGDIVFDEYGAYTQIQKKMLDEHFKVTASIRYDKSKNFDKGNFSPRVAVTYAVDKNKNHLFRGSYQTAFRNPTNQEQYVAITTGDGDYSLGTTEDNLNKFIGHKIVNYKGTDKRYEFTGIDILNNSYTHSSAQVFVKETKGTDESKLKKASFDYVEPETLTAFELGYRGTFNLFGSVLEIDANGYYGKYENITTEKTVVHPLYGKVGTSEAAEALRNRHISHVVIQTNSDVPLESYGGTIGTHIKLFKNFDFGLNYTYSDFKYDETKDPEFQPRFNTPKNSVKVQFGNNHLFKNFGFNINVRWQDEFLWQSALLQDVIEERTVLDAQLNYRIPSIKSRFKIGGTNLTGKEYLGVSGAGLVGSMYYFSWIIND